MLRLFNTLTKSVDDFQPLNPSRVTLYCCGPTVYSFAHIGNFRTYTMTDLLVRTLKYIGYPVMYVMNITDVGHLVSDADAGEDKMEKGARREGKTAWDIAARYTDAFLADSLKLNLLEPDVRPRPTQHIAEQIALVETLLAKGYAYRIDDGIYYDTSKFPRYGELTGQNPEELKAGARVEINPQKRNPNDFALWKFSPTDKKRDMEWDSPWGKGFPGWHIECSAMSTKYLGVQLDIHTGGADLIPIHHTNEIAQSEAASGTHPFVRYWVHGQFIQVDGQKMSKSKDNFHTIADIEARGYDPLALRYLYMTAQYRAFLNFTWEGLAQAAAALTELRGAMGKLDAGEAGDLTDHPLRQKFLAALENDLNLPQALAVVWETARASGLSDAVKRALLTDYDRVLALDLTRMPQERTEPVPEAVTELARRRMDLRKAKRWADADLVRAEIETSGYTVEDTVDGFTLKRKA
jgi:cysteinyl-tRNA synthetase